MTREECLAVFKKYGFTEGQIINMIVSILGAESGTEIEIKGQAMKAYLDTGLNVVYKGGKRFAKLEEAIKALANM